ncbi:peptidoglycan-binding protein [Bifidobacterium hapali]|uniref:Peptidoglycan-binding protein n=1 Tax=Bifidobacterium hapali TaxID=1630172 RepID=A0A261FYG0_9BIFI|nr:peptidoglycan-binding domain-containing protein [Bifidobacterium hapali]OZG64219.1 peptidoglycan-binding protein [Bifidobacterium hapali]
MTLTQTSTHQSSRRRHIITVIIAVVVVGALIVTGIVTQPWTLIGRLNTTRQSSQQQVDVTTLRTQPVSKGVLNAQTKLSASLQYDAASDFAAATGIITQLPVAGKQINIGEHVYEMDGVPVPLFRGERPFWRTLNTDTTDGPDVKQLEENLAELGFFTGTPDAHFDWLTREAVRQWQRSLGLTANSVDGVFQPASVAVVPATPIRITTVNAKLGASGASPASYTGTALHVAATLTATQAATFKAGDAAQVVLPDNTTIDTTLSAVDQGGQATGKDGQVTSPSARIDFPDQSKVAAFGATSVNLIIPNASATATSETLIVPVTALVASAGNSYAVDVVRGERLERIAVEIGLVANAQVQLTKADGLNVGDKVVVS